MIMQTLSDHLKFYQITSIEACKLFGRSQRTLKRWEDSPPEWVLRIVEMVGQHKLMPEIWLGWYFADEFLYDPDGNKYHYNDVRMLWLTLQRIRNYEDPAMIDSLKTVLQRKIDLLNSEIKLTIQVGDGLDGLTKEVKINPTTFLKKTDVLDVLVDTVE